MIPDRIRLALMKRSYRSIAKHEAKMKGEIACLKAGELRQTFTEQTFGGIWRLKRKYGWSRQRIRNYQRQLLAGKGAR